MEHATPDGPPDGGPLSFPGAVAVVRPHLERAQELGFFGPGPVDAQIRHALGFADAAGEPPARFLDLGSGGGLPGLVLMAVWPGAEGVLLDSNERRTAFLEQAIGELGWAARGHVVRARAEEAGRMGGLRRSLPLVVSRGFGPPPVVAECAAPLLLLDGCLIVSERPQEVDRWPAEHVGRLGLVPERVVVANDSRFQVLRQQTYCPDTFPRRVGVPGKRPLW